MGINRIGMPHVRVKDGMKSETRSSSAVVRPEPATAQPHAQHAALRLAIYDDRFVIELRNS